MTAINRAMDRLNREIVLADCLAQSFEDLAGDVAPPPWVHVVALHVEAIREASEALECLLVGYGGLYPPWRHTSRPALVCLAGDS